MSSFEKLSSELSEYFSVEIELSKSTSESGGLQLRFKDLDQGSTFFFAVYRNFSSTTIKLIPDTYGKNSILIIEKAILEKFSEVKNYLIEQNQKVGKLDFKLGNRQIIDLAEYQIADLSDIFYEAKVFTEDSNLQLGILNEGEIQLIYFTLRLFLIFLVVKSNGFISPDEALGYPEGSTTTVVVNKYERSPKNRKLCIEHFGLSCLGCGFNFADFYGDLGEQFIIVHHVVPVSKIGPDYVIDPKKDLIPLCANCHAIVHRKDPPLQLHELKKLTKFM